MFAWIWRTFLSEDRIGAPWCSPMHDSPRWHISGRPYLVPWGEPEQTGAPRLGGAALPSLHSAIRPVLLLMAVVAWPSLGRESVTADASAAAVLQRFMGSRGEAGAWPVETIQIEASLPRLKKTGRLRAIRSVFPIGQPDYKVLEIAGDATVKNQVIVRYISADEKATELAPSSVALTPANYKIHYAGTVWLGKRLTYVFRVIPRQKREGLINGESHRVAGKDRALLRRLADRRRLDARAVAAASPASRALLHEWLSAGWLRLEPADR